MGAPFKLKGFSGFGNIVKESGEVPGKGSPVKIQKLITKYPRVAKYAEAIGLGGYIGADLLAPEGSKTRKVMDVITSFDIDPISPKIDRIFQGISSAKKSK
tara:strand:+ start:446 stop:748 length:303 start_codon:yes stop_codon:yes gene_type:complete